MSLLCSHPVFFSTALKWLKNVTTDGLKMGVVILFSKASTTRKGLNLKTFLHKWFNPSFFGLHSSFPSAGLSSFYADDAFAINFKAFRPLNPHLNTHTHTHT